MAGLFNTGATQTLQRTLLRHQRDMEVALQRLSTGRRINSAADDPAGLAISERLEAEIRSLNQAERNALEGIDITQMADSTMQEASDLLTELRALAVESQNGTLTDSDRLALHNEAVALRSEIDRLANTTEFNGTSLLNGSGAITLQVGTGNTANDGITLASTDINTSALGTSAGAGGLSAISISTVGAASSAVAVIDAAIADLATRRGTVAGVQARLQSAVSVTQSTREAKLGAQSAIRDVDVAAETANFTKSKILAESTLALMAHANLNSNLVLQLLQSSS